MRDAFRINGKRIIPAQANRQSILTNISTTVVRCQKSLPNTVESLLRYVWANEELCTVNFVDKRVPEITDTIMMSNILALNVETAYARYVCITKMMLKNKGVLHLLVSDCIDVPVLKKLCMNHLDDQRFYICTDVHNFLMMQAADELDKDGPGPASSHSSAFNTLQEPSFANYTFVTQSSDRKSCQHLYLFSTKDSAGKEHYP